MLGCPIQAIRWLEWDHKPQICHPERSRKAAESKDLQFQRSQLRTNPGAPHPALRMWDRADDSPSVGGSVGASAPRKTPQTRRPLGPGSSIPQINAPKQICHPDPEQSKGEGPAVPAMAGCPIQTGSPATGLRSLGCEACCWLEWMTNLPLQTIATPGRNVILRRSEGSAVPAISDPEQIRAPHIPRLGCGIGRTPVRP
jgi:hypothetical protein